MWPGSHLVAHLLRQPQQPIAVTTVQVNQFQILALSSSALHRGVPNPSNEVKTRISALLVKEDEDEPAGEIHYCLGTKTQADEVFMRQTFLGCFDN